MGPDRLDTSFRRIAETGRTPLLPYVTAGWPDLAATRELICGFDAAGAGAVEIGFPYSDSIADGPVIQDSFHRVLAGGQRLKEQFQAVADVRSSVQVPLVAMVSFSIVHRAGVTIFSAEAAAAGFDGIIVPDLPLEEAKHVLDAAGEAGLKHIMLVATNTPQQRAARIASLSSGFVYQLAVSGTTGMRKDVADDLPVHVGNLRSVTKLPICVGFGISSPEQVKKAAKCADGVIVGSAIVRRITEGVDAGIDRERLLESTLKFVEQLIAAA